ncbi:MAG TPA: hypothetical protein VGL44_07000 [Gaiellales bacterium]
MATVHDPGNAQIPSWKYANGFIPHDGHGVIDEGDLNRVFEAAENNHWMLVGAVDNIKMQRGANTLGPGLLLLFRS